MNFKKTTVKRLLTKYPASIVAELDVIKDLSDELFTYAILRKWTHIQFISILLLTLDRATGFLPYTKLRKDVAAVMEASE